MVLGSLVPWLADALVILGVLVTTVGVYGILRMPDVYNKLHAAGKVVVLGLLSLLVASTVTGDPAFVSRAVLIGAFLLLTTPVSAHAIGRAAFLKEQRMESPEAVDESGHNLPNAAAEARLDGD